MINLLYMLFNDRYKMKEEPFPVAKIIINLVFVLFPIAFIYFVANEIVVAVAITTLLGGYFSVEYRKRESIVFIVGIILGLLIELIVNSSLKAFYLQDNLFIMPIWLPIFWGYIFVFIRRMGNLIVSLKD